MKTHLILTLILSILCPTITLGQIKKLPPGPLRVSANARYFTNSSGRAIYLTGSHTWNNFQDGGWSAPWGGAFWNNPNTFNYQGYLDWMVARDHNFIRLWTTENARDFRWNGSSWGPAGNAITPTLYVRQTGTTGNDGLQKFDLNQFNDAYFNRLRERIMMARERNIYVSIMLFDGWGVGVYSFFANGSSLPWWLGHPYHAGNNVNGINGGTNDGLVCHTLSNSSINLKQKAYVSKVIDTVQDLENVLFEIANESPANSTAWQNDMIAYIRNAELNTLTRMKHPVGFTGQYGGSNSTLTASNADWISPLTGGVGYETNPPEVPDATKVIILDTDHLLNNFGNPNLATRVWVWKSFMRGYNPIYMDQLASEPTVLGVFSPYPDSPSRDDVRVAMGYTRIFADQMNLVLMRPESSKSSTGYCLAKLSGGGKFGPQYLVYQPNQNAGVNSSFTVTLISGVYDVMWFKPSTGEYIAGSPETLTVTTGANTKTFNQPFAGDAVLYLVSV